MPNRPGTSGTGLAEGVLYDETVHQANRDRALGRAA